MPRFSAHLEFLYPQVPFTERIALAARDGFGAVECFFPYAVPAPEMAARLDDAGVEMVLFNATPRTHPQDRGVAALPGREAEFRDAFLRALDYAVATRCELLHAMAGIAPPEVAREALMDIYAGNLAWAAREAAACGRRIVIEPINQRDMPGYLINTQAQAHELIKRIGAPNVQVMMDLYHCQIVEGDLEMKLRRYLPTGRVGHVQVAGVPLRNEPDGGEVNFAHVFNVLDELGYAGWVGCEYRPRGDTSAGLRWLRGLRGLR